MSKTVIDSRPWVEKYRPRKIAEVSQQTEAKRLLSRIIETGNMPHLLFFGPPGSGKTSAALALVKELFGREDSKTRLLELNASDERGIRVVREKIKKYTRTNTPKGKINPETGREMPPWKIVMLDEADMMTPDAQAALRRIMEAFARNTRFIIICNYVHKIIDPLFSRCSPHRFEPVSPDAQMERLHMICKAENLTVEDRALERLMNLTCGDLRRAVNLLQSAAGIHRTITEDAILEVAVHPPTYVVQSVLTACATSPEAVNEVTEEVANQGWDVALLLQEASAARSVCVQNQGEAVEHTAGATTNSLDS
ncbi:replication factor C small subunit, putative [Eimeria necatrix]|uniref:Replication factor C small subunit, putative n=1 Tax=Eimeria necatrix TaxID=51315 RepID=U6N073_9EIME|nr:replication factor C small subunit, putative [Eimeria necatrix]CDJ69597.1 replication factor C small subunit, putative [Eimeria necatrix]